MNSKFRIALMVLTFFCGSLATAWAQPAKDIFQPEVPITYLGIDFTQARLIGDSDANEQEVRDKYFGSINDVVINEPKKYDLRGAFQKSEVAVDISLVQAKNSKAEPGKIKSSKEADGNRFTRATVEEIVKGYDFGSKKGVGVLFIMESLNKTALHAAMYVTFIDMSAGKVLFTERLTGKCGGFGFRNYWARSVYEVLQQIEKTKYKEWKKGTGTSERTAMVRNN